MFPIHDDTERIHGRPYVNYSLIAINVIVFVWEVIVTGYFSDEQAVAEIFSKYGAVPRSVLNGDLISILTSMFMHGGIAHIIGNMVFLFVFGDNIEDRFGHIKYLLIYIAWGAAAAIIHSIFAVSSGGGMIPAVGASGAISGVMGAYLIMFPRAKIFTVIIAFFITTIRIPALAYIPFWFILQVIFGLIDPFGGVAYLAHIGGFVAGLGTGYTWKLFFSGKNIINPLFKTDSQITRKQRPKIEESIPQASPEVIEGPDFYEIIAEIHGVSDATDINASFEPDTGNVRIIARGSRNYNMLAKLPTTAVKPTVEYIHYLNGIARIRLTK
ncbi:MAG: rhomboid family intramembrane serine protease [Thermoproteota archaeon]|nr:rhomboid family intramembrane serine protease [Thermoproteota archaeon]